MRTCSQRDMQWDPSIPDTMGPEWTVLILEVSLLQGLKMYYGKAWRIILVPVVCVLISGVSAIQGSGLEGFHCIRTYDVKSWTAPLS